MTDDLLRTALLDLAFEMRDAAIPLMLGGGYGLYLKQVILQELRVTNTIILPEFWPRPRATEDLDVILQTEIIASLDQMKSIRSALDALNYRVIEGVKYMHFEKSLGDRGRVKIEFLTGPLPADATRGLLRIKPPRVRPEGDVKLHAYIAEEALAFEDAPTRLLIRGLLSSGEPFDAPILVPQPFTLLLMKLHAFSDRKDDADRNLGRHHALDLYRIVAMLTRQEHASVRTMCATHRNSGPVVRATAIVAHDFATTTSIGMLRLREHELFPQRADPAQFVAILQELFE